jgi:hypothetical protein
VDAPQPDLQEMIPRVPNFHFDSSTISDIDL